jgi:hypothetical protein
MLYVLRRSLVFDRSRVRRGEKGAVRLAQIQTPKGFCPETYQRRLTRYGLTCKAGKAKNRGKQRG